MRLLVIEDEPDLRTTLSRALREEGYAVDVASDGKEGLLKATHCDYDAVVLDVMLPKMDGWGVLQGIRAHKATPVLMLTAREAMADRIRGLDGGADDYVPKPFDLGELLARIRALIRRSSGKAESRIRVGALEIDLPARRVSFHESVVPLTAREYSLLEFLILHRGEVVSRTTLYEHLFDEEDDSMSNLLDVHVSNLRKKLGASLITTRRGHGYCIE